MGPSSQATAPATSSGSQAAVAKAATRAASSATFETGLASWAANASRLRTSTAANTTATRHSQSTGGAISGSRYFGPKPPASADSEDMTAWTPA